MRVLFVCHYNRKRSATAERIFGKKAGLEVRSAGTSPDALVRVNQRMLEWAELIFIMDGDQSRDLARMFPAPPALERLVCLEIPDRYDFLDPELVSLLHARTAAHLARPKDG